MLEPLLVQSHMRSVHVHNDGRMIRVEALPGQVGMKEPKVATTLGGVER